MKPPRLLLADSHPIVIEGLRHLLGAHFEIVGSAEDGRTLVAAAEKLRPEVIVVDTALPLLNGVEAVRQIRRTNQRVKVVFLASHADAANASEALRAGGSAYVLKRSAVTEILDSIRQALRGRTYLTPLIDAAVVRSAVERAGRRNESELKLTSRQREVLQLVAEGCTGKQIGSILHVSPRTVEFHKYRITKTLGLATTADLVQYAIRRGIVPR